jgi:hypothetical protein
VTVGTLAAGAGRRTPLNGERTVPMTDAAEQAEEKAPSTQVPDMTEVLADAPTNWGKWVRTTRSAR